MLSAVSAGCASANRAATVAHNERWLPWLTAEISKLGLDVTPSVGNFLLINFPKDDPEKGAIAADTYLKSRGIILRRVAGYKLPDALRMTVGTEADNRAVVAALSEFQKGARA